METYIITDDQIWAGILGLQHAVLYYEEECKNRPQDQTAKEDLEYFKGYLETLIEIRKNKYISEK